MKNAIKRRAARQRRKRSIRKRISGTGARPRLSVFRSAKHIYAQVIDDLSGKTLASASTMEPAVRDQIAELDKSAAAAEVGKLVAARCQEKSIDTVVFDRNGYIYHGRVKSLAEGAREGGLKF